jgi:hypothetical protein
MGARDVLTYKIEVNAEMRELSRLRSEWKQTVDQLTMGLNISIGGAMLSGIYRVISGLQSATEAGLQFRNTIEDLETSFQSLLGSQGAALSRMKDLKKFAAETPFEMPEIAQASRVLQTLTKGALASGGGLTMVGNVAAATGRDFRELAVHVGRLYDGLQSGREVGRALQELQQMGVVSGEVRNRIERMQKSGEQGSKIWAVAAKEFERFAGEMDRRSQTLNGLSSTLADTWNDAMSDMMGASAEARKAILRDLIAALESPETRRSLRELGQEIAKITTTFGEMAVWAAKNADKLKDVANAIVAIGKAWATYKIGSLAIGGGQALAARMASSGASPAAQTAAAGAVAATAVSGSKVAEGAASQIRMVGNAKLIAASNQAAAEAAEMAARAGAASKRAEAFVAAATGAQVGQMARSAQSLRARAEATAAEIGAKAAAQRAELAAQKASESYRVVRAGSDIPRAGKSAPLATIGGALNASLVGVSIGMIVKSLMDDQTDAVEAQEGAWKAINRENDAIAKGYKDQLGTLGSMGEKQAMIQQVTAEIARLTSERDNSPELTAMQKRLGVADQVRGAYDAHITRLNTILKLTNNISDADLKRKEAEAAKARNREESAAIQTERDADAKKRAIANRGEQLSKDLSRIQNETARAQIGVRMAKGGEAAEIDAGISGTDRQIAAVNGAIVDLQAELTATESSLETLRESNAQAFGEALQKVDDLKKAIPDLQGELDRLNTQRMEESFRRSQASIDKTGQALRLAVPSGVDSVTGAATAGMRGDKATLARLGMRGVEMAAPVAMRRDMDAPAARSAQSTQDIAANTRETVKVLLRVRDLMERQEAQGTYVPVF